MMFFAIKGMAQTIETAVSGTAVDTKHAPIESATISLMKSKDSSVIKRKNFSSKCDCLNDCFRSFEVMVLL